MCGTLCAHAGRYLNVPSGASIKDLVLPKLEKIGGRVTISSANQLSTCLCETVCVRGLPCKTVYASSQHVIQRVLAEVLDGLVCYTGPVTARCCTM